VSNKFKVKPTYQKHEQNELQENMQAVRESEIFFIFGNKAWIRGYKNNSENIIELVNLAKQIQKPFILCLDKTLPISDQIYLRKLCPNDTQVFSFNPESYSGTELHEKMLIILESAINKGTISDPFKE
jgi:hypothetical protein